MMKPVVKKIIRIVTILLAVVVNQVTAQSLQVAFPFADHAVLQREKAVPVWGKAKPGEKVTVALGENDAASMVGEDGHWVVYLSAMPAGGPYTLLVSSGTEQLRYNDVYVGDVWLVSGQSNMAWTLGNGVGANTGQEIAAADFPLIRFLNVPNETHSVPTECYNPVEWKICTPQHVAGFSAVAYFFARELHCNRNVPVGIISASWGATNIEAWMSAERLQTHDAYAQWVHQFDADSLRWQIKVAESRENDRMRDVLADKTDRGLQAKIYHLSYDDSAWPFMDAPLSIGKMNLKDFWGVVWLRTSFTLSDEWLREPLRLTGDINARKLDFWLNGTQLTTTDSVVFPRELLKKRNQLTVRMYVHWNSGWLGTNEHPLRLSGMDGTRSFVLDQPWRFNADIEPRLPGWQNYYNTNTVIYNAMIHPLMPYGLCGICWYQGENNAGQGRRYRTLLPMLIDDWRIGFQQGNLPFITIQLANYMKRMEQPSESGWAELREAQAFSLRYPQTGLVTTIDIGEANDIHPRNKLDVGRRLYKQAQVLAYGDHAVGCGPLFRSMQITGNEVRIRFDHASGGLQLKDSTLAQPFALAGEDRKFYWADRVRAEDDTVLLRCDHVSVPVAVRYGWADNPVANLYNKEGFPAVPFRTDDWDKEKR